MSAQIICDAQGGEISEVSLQQMREKLQSIGIDVPAKAKAEEVQTLYKQMEDGNHDHFEVQIQEDVTMPMKPTKALHLSEEVFVRLKKVEVHDMDQFVLDREISFKTVSEFIHILATFSKFEARPKGERLSYKYSMPTNVIKMAHQC